MSWREMFRGKFTQTCFEINTFRFDRLSLLFSKCFENKNKPWKTIWTIKSLEKNLRYENTFIHNKLCT